MELKILGLEDPRDFKNRRVRIMKQGDFLDIRILEPEMNFPELMKLRTQHDANAENIYRSVRTGSGYDFANLGVSGVFTITIDGKDYVLAAEQRRPDIGDFAAKLISGYVDSQDLIEPFNAMKREIAEEVLPVAHGEKLIRFNYQGTDLPRPFSEHFRDFPGFINLVKPAKYHPPNLEKSPILIKGKHLEGSPMLYFQVPTNSAQLVYSFHLNQGDSDFRNLGLSLHHSEDKLNKEKKVLEKMLHPAGILLIRLENQDLTEQVSHYSNGEFIPVNPETINLSEAFAPKHEGVVEAKNIPLLDYINQKERHGLR